MQVFWSKLILGWVPHHPVFPDPPSTCLPASFFSSLSYFRPLMLPLTCTVSMVFQLPETPVQLSMATRSVSRLLHPWVLFGGKRRKDELLFKFLLLCCSCAVCSVASASSAIVGLVSRSFPVSFFFLTTLNTWWLTHTSKSKLVCPWNPWICWIIHYLNLTCHS